MSGEQARTLVFCNYNALRERYMAFYYDYAQVIAAVEPADILAPPAPASRMRVELDRARSLASRYLKFGATPHIQSTAVEKDYELFVLLACFPREAAELRRVKGWRQRCKTAIAVISETWISALDDMGAVADILRQFDVIYTATTGSSEEVARRLGRSVRVIAHGVDMQAMAPVPVAPKRIFDVTAMGRTPPGLLSQLRAADARGELVLQFDVIDAPAVITTYHDHRINKNGTLQRTRYFPCNSVRAFLNRKQDEAGAEQDCIPFRFFEGAGAGCVMFGQAPDSAQWKALFDWPDAVVECPPDHPDFLQFLLSLDSDPDRVRAIRVRNVANGFRKLDWVYRWEQILGDLGMSVDTRLTARKAWLATMADQVETQGLPSAPTSRFGTV